jgi:transposase
MTEKLSSEHGKKRMRGRSCLIEHVFGETKEIFRFRRFLHRGLEKVRLIWQLVCIGYNFRKMARLAYG